jgi:ribulose-5-phosphate 4-epimerase/fuculose-1-phosphate aldolase
MPDDDLAALREDLVTANRILAREGVVDAYGHVSVRRPDAPGVFLLTRSRSPGLVLAEDVMEFDLNGAALHGDARPTYVERLIHAAIYALRPDVSAVVHSHARQLLPFTVSTVPLRPVIHVAGMIGAHIPKWDIADEFGDTDLLVRTLGQGEDLARTLGGCACALMRGHGAVVVGASLREAVVRSIFLKMNAETQLAAQALGECRALSAQEAALSEQTHRGGHVLQRAWEYYCGRCGRPA